MRKLLLLLCTPLLAASLAGQTAAPAPVLDWSLVEKILGRAPTEQGGVRKVVFWRTDFPATVGPTRLAPAAALTSWMAFREVVGAVLADGDLVLLPNEVPAVMDALQQHGFEITGLHNHLLGERPQVMFLHFFARGELPSILQGLKAALQTTRTPLTPAGAPPGAITYDRKAIEEIMGKAGNATGVVLSFGFPRGEPITMHANTLPAPMGMATAINFQPSGSGVAATGDFVLLEQNVAPVLLTLRKAGVVVTAMHNHLMDETPRLVFVHFWAEGKADEVARALRAALDAAH